jgi:hypothetical protein
MFLFRSKSSNSNTSPDIESLIDMKEKESNYSCINPESNISSNMEFNKNKPLDNSRTKLSTMESEYNIINLNNNTNLDQVKQSSDFTKSNLWQRRKNLRLKKVKKMLESKIIELKSISSDKSQEMK